MVKPGVSGGPSGDSDRCLTPIIGLVLLIGMVVVGASAILLTAGSAVNDAESQADEETAELNLEQVDQRVATMTFGDKNARSIHLEDPDSGKYEIVEDGRLNVTVTNGFGSACSTEYPLQSLQYEDESGDTIGYQAGGMFRNFDSGGSYTSAPDLRYFTETAGEHDVRKLDFQLTNLEGDVGTGDHTAKQRLNDDSSLECFDDETFGYAQGLELTVSGTQFHEGWYQFLRTEFDAVDAAEAGPDDEVIIEHAPADREVTVTAPLDYDRPFVHYVDVEQTIYGGLYVDVPAREDLDLSDDVSIDGYDSRDGPYEAENATADLLASNADLDLDNDAELDAYAVTNGDLRTHHDTEISQYGFYTGDHYEDDRGYRNHDAIAFEISERFDEIEPIDEEIDLAKSFLGGAPEPSTDPIEAGLYHEDGDLTLDDTKIDTTDGDVHVYVEEDLELSNVRVTGSNRVYFYVDDEIDVEGDVRVPDDRAGSLWVYGTSRSDVSVEEDVTFSGVLYAPGSGGLEIEDDVDIYGAVVAGHGDDRSCHGDDHPGRGHGRPCHGDGHPGHGDDHPGHGDDHPVFGGHPSSGRSIGDDVEIHFDRSLRTDVPLPPDERSFEYEYRKPIDASIVLDTSHSMTVNDPEERRFAATEDFIDYLDEDKDDMAGLYDFHHESDTDHPMSYDLESVKDSTGGTAWGFTNISTGMKIALDDHEEVSDRWDDRKRVMVLLADGENNFNVSKPPDHPHYGNVTRADEKTMEQAERADDMGVTIFTIGLGYADLDEELLQDVADATGGENININESGKLQDIFTNIASEVTERAVIDFEGTPPDTWAGTNDHVVDVVEYDVDLEDN